MPVMRDAASVATTLAVWGLCLAASSGHAATYYVDQTAGSDQNAGTSPSAAWRNSPGMSAYGGSAILAPGDVIYFDSADTWDVTGTQGLYLVGGVTYIGNQWGTGTRARLRAASNLDSAVVRFRDHPTMETIIRGFDIDANGKVTNGVEMNHSFYAGPLTGTTKVVDDVIVHHVWSRTSQGQYKYGIIVSNHGGRNGEVANVEVTNSVVHDISRDGLPIYPGDESADCIVRNVVVRGNTVYNTGQDPDYGAGAGIIVKGRVIDAVIESNYVTATKGAGIFVNGNESNHFGSGPEQIHIRFNIVNVNTIHGSIRLYDGSSGKDPKDVRIYGNIVYGNTSNGGLLLDSDLGNSNTIRVYNNTFVDAPVVVRAGNASFPIFEFINNIVYASSGTPMTENGKFTAHSRNTYFGSGTLVTSRGAHYTANTLTSFEADASGLDPKFVDRTSPPAGFRRVAADVLLPAMDGFALQERSPSIDRGMMLAASFANSINAVARPAGTGWDVGAYEAPTGTRPNPPTDLRVIN